jgi:GntR family transcriptional regulator/MocR family aminotransferase
MARTWATFTGDLLLELRGTRRRVGLEAALREAVRSDRLAPGTPLPSSRALAIELGLARNTVADAYAQLIAEGWLAARHGAGTRVADRIEADGRHRDLHSDVVRPPRTTQYSCDLRPGIPNLAAFPRTAWSVAARKALAQAPSQVLGYPDPRGLPSLRQTLVEYLARVRGVRTTSEHVVICSGFVQALHLLSTALRRAGLGGGVGIESYGLGIHRDIIEAAGLTTHPLTVDDGGARVDELTTTNSAAVLLTPAHQLPIGVALAAQRRADVLRWASEHGRLVIEDDYDGEFRYDARPVGAMQSLAPDLVAYIGTASKSLAPGLSLAWLVVPAHALEGVLEAKRLSDRYTGIFEQLTLDEFIRSGGYDKHVRRSRLRYRQRRDALVSVLADRAPDVAVTGIAAGLHAVLQLRRGLRAADEPSICSRAGRAGLAVQGLGEFRRTPQPTAAAALVVGYGTPPDHAFAGALDALCDVLG